MCVGGGGGITHAFLLSTADRQEKKIMPLPTHAGARKIIISIHHHQDIGVGRCFDSGRGGRHFSSKFLYDKYRHRSVSLIAC